MVLGDSSGLILLYSFELQSSRGRGDVLVPRTAHPTDLYDPFGQFVKSRNDQGVPPYVEFANLDPNKPEDLLKYANRCGVPTSPCLDVWVDTWGEDREISRSDIFREIPALAAPRYPLEKFKWEIWNMRGTLDRKCIAEGGDDKESIERFDRDYREPYLKRTGRTGRKRDAAVAVKGEVEMRLRGVYPSVKIRRNGLGFERGYRCRLFRHALYLTLLEDISMPIRKCADPRCGNFFPLVHRGKKCCSGDCTNRFNVRRSYWRKKRDEKGC